MNRSTGRRPDRAAHTTAPEPEIDTSGLSPAEIVLREVQRVGLPALVRSLLPFSPAPRPAPTNPAPQQPVPQPPEPRASEEPVTPPPEAPALQWWEERCRWRPRGEPDPYGEGIRRETIHEYDPLHWEELDDE